MTAPVEQLRADRKPFNACKRKNAAFATTSVLALTDRFGAPRARPEAKILNDSRNAVKNIFRELGFDLADDNSSRPSLIAGRYK